MATRPSAPWSENDQASNSSGYHLHLAKAPTRGNIDMASVPVSADIIPAQQKKTNYPKQLASIVQGRTKRKLGDFFELSNFGVNLTQLAPGAASALLHRHSRQDEFVYILKGTPTLILDQQEFALVPGDCMGFKAGSGVAHQLVNRSGEAVTYIEIGDRAQGDQCEYPNDDLKARLTSGGSWEFTHKDGSPY